MQSFSPDTHNKQPIHYDDVILGAMASKITSLTIVYSTVYSGADQSKHQSSASLAFVWGISPGTGEFPAQMASNKEIFPFDDVIMILPIWARYGVFIVNSMTEFFFYLCHNVSCIDSNIIICLTLLGPYNETRVKQYADYWILYIYIYVAMTLFSVNPFFRFLNAVILGFVLLTLTVIPRGSRQLNFVQIYGFSSHDDVIKRKHFPHYWPFVRGIHRWPVNSPHKGRWRGALMFSVICAWFNGWVNTREAGDLRRHRSHCDVTLMESF